MFFKLIQYNIIINQTKSKLYFLLPVLHTSLSTFKLRQVLISNSNSNDFNLVFS